MATTKDYIEYVCERLHGAGVPELAALMADAERGLPYEGAKEHYILDIDDTDLARQVVAVLETVTPLPKPKKKKAE